MTAGGARGEGGWLAAWVPGEVLGCPRLLEAEGWVYLAGLLSAPCILDAWLGSDDGNGAVLGYARKEGHHS